MKHGAQVMGEIDAPEFEKFIGEKLAEENLANKQRHKAEELRLALVAVAFPAPALASSAESRDGVSQGRLPMSRLLPAPSSPRRRADAWHIER